ncbi:penicillin-binding protein 2 [Pseudomonas mosselii]|uniref:peptidoglycan D,D-transpeptidase FtsI family protein n=1 Tax=Pseudomonas mosselii TaxID=78327 RepID=UPI002DB66011|nr:penicillin-binding protein 2 [Pseudomonas mosselii]MEB5932409.1 penicillin-binding protein 2 [Pseudomonas mosselii]
MKAVQASSNWRFRAAVALVVLLSAILCARLFQLQVCGSAFLIEQGNSRSLRHLQLPASRGLIIDRRDQPLAVSTPVTTLWADPRILQAQRTRWPELARLLEMDLTRLIQQLDVSAKRGFVYLRRRLPPHEAQRLLDSLKNADIKGVSGLEESQRFYPAGAIAAHITGFTDDNEQGIEGVELAFDSLLRGTPGIRQVIKDRKGNLSSVLSTVRPARPGQTLKLSIDMRLQYLAFRELKLGIEQEAAVAGSAVVMDIRSGELLALVSLPTYNPNNRASLPREAIRNRALTDVFEPASSVKPFAMAAALESGRWKPTDTVDVGNGTLKIGRYTVRDVSRSQGRILSLNDILLRSSNVGMSKIAFDIGGERVHSLLSRLGFGVDTSLGFPGERAGVLPAHRNWNPAETATLSYGYGLSVTAVQLARAYATLANQGQLVEPTLVARRPSQSGAQVIPADVARTITHMLTRVVEANGGTYRARIPGYQVAGKSGTARKTAINARGYRANAYQGIFAGFAPANAPRFVVVVVIDEPSKRGYYGGLVAAPVFSRIMAAALRLNNVSFDGLRPAVQQ